MSNLGSRIFLVSGSVVLLWVASLARANPPIVVPMNLQAQVTFYSQTLETNPLVDPRQFISPHLDKKIFSKVNLELRKGQELRIDSLVLSQNTLATYYGLTRGTDALQAGVFESKLDTQDRQEFLELILEMARVRRHAENQSEWNQITQTVKGQRAHFNDYLFQTDYVVVVMSEIGSSSESREEVKYYVPLKEILDGAAEIDLYSAKLAILQSISLKVFNGLIDTEDYNGAEDVKAQLKKISESLQGICKLRDHNFTGNSPVGCFVSDMGALHCAGKNLKLSDSDAALLKLRKQLALFQRIKKEFPSLPGLEGLELLAKKEHFQVSCDDRETLFKDLNSTE